MKQNDAMQHGTDLAWTEAGTDLACPPTMAQTLLTSTARARPADGMDLACGTTLATRGHMAQTLHVARPLLVSTDHARPYVGTTFACGTDLATCEAGTVVACGMVLAWHAPLARRLLAAADCAQRCPKAAPKHGVCHRAGRATGGAVLGRYKGRCAPATPLLHGFNAAARACAQCPLYSVRAQVADAGTGRAYR